MKDCTGARDREQGGETGRCGAEHAPRPQARRQLQQATPDSLHADEMEFLDINLSKDTRFLLYAVQSSVYWRILKKTILFSLGLTINTKKICGTRKLESVHE